MAIKIAGTEVIGSLRHPTNITDTIGLYTRLSAGIYTSGTTIGNPSGQTNMQINMNDTHRPISDYMTNGGMMAGTVNWNLAGAEPGVQKILLVDATTSGFDQSFSWASLSGTGGGTIRYPNDTEPDYTLARYWMHCITVWNNSELSIVSTSWSA